MTPENILWKSFLGEAPEREFDANRYQNWRFFWDYSGGNVYENMCHQLSIWYKLLNLDVPRSANMSGGLYLWKDGREVPDTMNVAMEHDNDMMFMWNSGFGNNYLGVSENVLGTDATLVHTSGQTLRYLPQKVNQPNGTEMVGQTKAAPGAHMRNFIDCIRSGQTPNCPFEIGFRTSIACRMAVESYRQKRTIRWDPESEELV
jgi:predicted dehydrogenase